MQRLTIGAFSRLTHLSITTLRYYHETGLLEPAVIDPDSGYRYYQPGQAHSAHLDQTAEAGVAAGRCWSHGPRGAPRVS
jgi:DNA-binding transcriptional MerR regulator